MKQVSVAYHPKLKVSQVASQPERLFDLSFLSTLFLSKRTSKSQNVQPYDFIEARADSADCLQAAAKVAFVFGLAASLLQLLRHCAIAVLYCARAVSGTLLDTQAS